MKPKPIKAVIFDMGGVIYEWQESWRQAGQAVGVDPENFLQTLIKLGPGFEKSGISLNEAFKQITASFGQEDKWQILRQYIPVQHTWIGPTRQLLIELQGKYRLVILTNNIRDLMNNWEKVAAYKQYFDLIVDSSELGMRKPEPEIFLYTAKKLKLKPSQCLFVDDLEKNILAAKQLGMKTVHFVEPKKGVAKIKEILGLK